MNDSDDQSGRAGTSGVGDRHIPASDFARRRVADILRRERPLLEQGLPLPDLNLHIERMMQEAPDHTISWSFKPGLNVFGFCRWRRTEVSATTNLRVCWQARKRGGANLNSRFLGRPGG